MTSPTDWTSAFAILAAGLILGMLVFFASRWRKASAATRRVELEARRDALVEQLRDLGDDVAGEEREWLERETAGVLRALDRLPAPAGNAEPRRESQRRPFVWGVASTLVVGGIAWYGSTFMTPRESAVPTADVEQRIALAQTFLSRNEILKAFEQTQAVLAQNPEEPRALTYNAIVRMAMGDAAGARAILEQVTQRHPEILDAWVALASARMHAGDERRASAAIQSAIAQAPAEESRLRQVLADIRKQPPRAAPSESDAASVAPVRITVSLDPALTVRSGVLYVIARGNESGHPVAVRRIPAAAFPLSIELGAADSMMGQQLPPSMRIEARLDSDGDAGTTDAAEPRAQADGVKTGASVALTLARAN